MMASSITYNGLDTRVELTDSAGTKTFQRDGVGVTAPVLTDGTATFTASGENRGGLKTSFHSALKNTDLQTNSAGAVTAERQYDAFGNVIASSGAWTSQFGNAGRFGYQEDPDSELKLLGHRYYDSSTGRFLTMDPAKDSGNWFIYCGNNPVDRFDSTGLWLESALDLLGLFYDIIEFAKDPSIMNGLFVVWSAGASLLPAVPGSWVARAAQKGAQYVGKRGEELAAVLRGGFRDRMLKMGALPFKGAVAHHIIPVALAETILARFAKKFPGGEAALIEFMRNPSNGMWVDPTKHAKMSKEYQRRLEKWLRDHPDASIEKFLDYAKKLSDELFAPDVG